MDVTSFILGFKKGAASGGGGGGSVEGVHTVTFMSEDGSAVLYERYVADGDDCANVVDRGLLATPTKASTAQYSYTYSGWSLTSGGSANASALKSVTTDRTVYVAFTSSVRYYTITYYDVDTVPKTESLPYGSMPSYMPVKDGYSFNGWEPALAVVTSDAVYHAQFTEMVVGWKIESDGTLRIYGEGEMKNYSAVYNNIGLPPWHSRANEITSVVVEEGVTHIGDYAFYELANIVSVSILNEYTTIGSFAFANCSALTSLTLPNKLTFIPKQIIRYSGVTSFTIPASVNHLDGFALYGANNLATVVFEETTGWYKSSDGVAIGDAIDVTDTQYMLDFFATTNGTYKIVHLIRI